MKQLLAVVAAGPLHRTMASQRPVRRYAELGRSLRGCLSAQLTARAQALLLKGSSELALQVREHDSFFFF